MFYGIKYLIVTLVFSHLGFWSGNLFLIASFPDLCLLVPLDSERLYRVLSTGVHKEDLPRFTLFSSLLYPKVISIFWSPLAKNSLGTN